VQKNATKPSYLFHASRLSVHSAYGYTRSNKSLPSGCSKSRSSSEEDFSKGRSRSQSLPSTCVRLCVCQLIPSPWREKESTFAITVFSARLLLIPSAIDMGEDSQLVPSFVVPSGKVMVMDSRGMSVTIRHQFENLSRGGEEGRDLLAIFSSYSFFSRSNIWIRESKYSGLGSNSSAAIPATTSPFFPFLSFFSFFGWAGGAPSAAGVAGADSVERAAAGSAGVAVDWTGWGAVDMLLQSLLNWIRTDERSGEGRTRVEALLGRIELVTKCCVALLSIHQLTRWWRESGFRESIFGFLPFTRSVLTHWYLSLLLLFERYWTPSTMASSSSTLLSASNSRVELSLSAPHYTPGSTLRPSIHYKEASQYTSTSLRLLGETKATIMGKERWVRLFFEAVIAILPSFDTMFALYSKQEQLSMLHSEVEAPEECP